jgi:hypothetical protein
VASTINGWCVLIRDCTTPVIGTHMLWQRDSEGVDVSSVLSVQLSFSVWFFTWFIFTGFPDLLCIHFLYQRLVLRTLVMWALSFNVTATKLVCVHCSDGSVCTHTWDLSLCICSFRWPFKHPLGEPHTQMRGTRKQNFSVIALFLAWIIWKITSACYGQLA